MIFIHKMKYLDIALFAIVFNFSLISVICRLHFDVSYFNKRPSVDSRIRAFTEYSLRQCLEECARRSNCEAAGYQRFVQFCELFSDSVLTSTNFDYVTIKKEHMALPEIVS